MLCLSLCLQDALDDDLMTFRSQAVAVTLYSCFEYFQVGFIGYSEPKPYCESGQPEVVAGNRSRLRGEPVCVSLALQRLRSRLHCVSRVCLLLPSSLSPAQQSVCPPAPLPVSPSVRPSLSADEFSLEVPVRTSFQVASLLGQALTAATSSPQGAAKLFAQLLVAARGVASSVTNVTLAGDVTVRPTVSQSQLDCRLCGHGMIRVQRCSDDG